ncbi:MAG: alpha/beta fold hydrolase [Dyella sp.]
MRHLLLCLPFLLPWIAQAAPSTDDCAAHSQALLDALHRGDAQTLTTHFNPAMHQAADPARLINTWQRFTDQWGVLQEIGHAQSKPGLAARTVVITPLHFAQKTIDAVVACDADGSVAGLHFVPEATSAATTMTPLPPGVSQQSLQVPTPLGPLPATLTFPSAIHERVPAVLLVAGSGPSDGDETIGPNKPFRDLAIKLAQAEIASLRYDKRTLTYGARMAGQNMTIDQEVTDDALTALKLLHGLPTIDPQHVYLLGHSLGAMLAPKIAQKTNDLAGVILMAAPARPLQRLLLEQLTRKIEMHTPATAERQHQLDALQAQVAVIDQLDPQHLPKTPLLLHLPASYWLSLRDYDPMATAQALKVPMLVLQGDRDVQVSAQRDFGRWRQAFVSNPRVRLIDYPTLSHLFMPAGDPPGPADYRRPAHVADKVIGDIVQWIDDQLTDTSCGRCLTTGEMPHPVTHAG